MENLRKLKNFRRNFRGKLKSKTGGNKQRDGYVSFLDKDFLI